MSSDVPIIGLDTETAGACRYYYDGSPLPLQRTFHPRKMLRLDGIPLDKLVLTTQITLVSPSSPLSPSHGEGGFSFDDLRYIEPGETIILEMHKAHDRAYLRRWLEFTNVIVGHNILYDITVLRALPEFRAVLSGRHTLVDTSVLNYLHDENRPEKSLKTLGPVLQTHAYKPEDTLKYERFHSPTDPRFIKYAASDPHNTLLLARALAIAIAQDFGVQHDKLGAYCTRHYSDTLWACVRKSEAGTPIHREVLESVEQSLDLRVRRLERVLERNGITLSGKGSDAVKRQWLTGVGNSIDELRSDGTSVFDDPGVEFTNAQHLLSFNKANLHFFHQRLFNEDPAHPDLKNLRRVEEYIGKQKILSSYTWPLLRHKRANDMDYSSCLVAQNGTDQPMYTGDWVNEEPIRIIRNPVFIAYPTWYPTPGMTKDDSGSEGGTKQGRITCKNPALQTLPPIIKKCIRSRWPDGSVFWWDLSQIELRVSGLWSGEPALVDFYCHGVGDLHTDRAAEIFGLQQMLIKYGPEWASHPGFRAYERPCGKMVNFADQYRAGPLAMQAQTMKMAGVEFPLELFERVVRDRPRSRPVLYLKQSEYIEEVRRKGYAWVPFTGQTRYFLGGDKWDENEIVNFPIQTMAGNTLLAIEHELHRMMPSLNDPKPPFLMCCQVYDSILFDCRAGREEELRALVEEAKDNVEYSGYWADLQDHFGRQVPLEGEW